MKALRRLADRLTGQEAARAADDQRRWCEKIRASDRDNHAREIQQLRLAALSMGVILHKQPDDWVDITYDGGTKWAVSKWAWRADAIHESNVEAAREAIIDDTRREAF